MKGNGFWRMPQGLAAGWSRLKWTLCPGMSLNRGACMVLAFTGLAVLSSGCASDKGVLTSAAAGGSSTEAQVCRFGTVALAEELTPATFSYQKAKGKRGTVKQAFIDSAELGLSGPGAGIIVTGEALEGLGSVRSDGAAYMVVAAAGAAGGVTAVGAALVGPVVGAEELYLSMKKVSREELAQRETVLTNALYHMADQRAFQDALVEIGAERIRGGLHSTERHTGSLTSVAAGADAVLATHVDELRLERAGPVRPLISCGLRHTRGWCGSLMARFVLRRAQNIEAGKLCFWIGPSKGAWSRSPKRGTVRWRGIMWSSW